MTRQLPFSTLVDPSDFSLHDVGRGQVNEELHGLTSILCSLVRRAA